MTEIISREEIEVYLNKNCNEVDMIKKSIYNAAEVANKFQLWSWFREYEPPNGYIWNTHFNTELMKKEVDGDGHSGGSFGYTMRVLQKISIDYQNTPDKFVI